MKGKSNIQPDLFFNFKTRNYSTVNINGEYNRTNSFN